ncbi:MAG: hypothetical protein KF773_12320 [Deltaproteobacteria bacterium]|nr:hypothetical protein [Deltaproteobacteria bacterium]
MGLDRDKLHTFFSAKAKDGVTVTYQEVADHFGVDVGGASKAMDILTGHSVLVETSRGVFNCSRVPELSVTAFASAASQGKLNTAFVDGLFAKIDQLRKNNDTMRTKLHEAQAQLTVANARIAELEERKP